MALFIVGSYKASPYDPDSAFDPVTHVATEAAFIQLLEHGVYDSKYIGYKVQLGNSVNYNNGLWVIADVNHDSENTGQSNCYDLISEDCFYNTTFSSSNNQWRSSTPRTWLNGTFYNGFSSNLKNRLMNPKYNSQGTWYTDDYVILPSFIEVNGNVPTNFSNVVVEGVKYPIFESGSSSRIKNRFGGSAYYWWTRSRSTSGSSYVWFVYSDGSMTSSYYDSYYNLAPLMRVH